MLGTHIEVGGRRFDIEYINQRRRTVAAYFYNSKVTIKLPLRIGYAEKERAIRSLEKRIIRRLEKLSSNGFEELDRPNALPNFSDGQRIRVMNREFTVSITEEQGAKHPRARLIGNNIAVNVPAFAFSAGKDERVADLVRLVLSKCMLPDIRARLDEINRSYYNLVYNDVRIRKQMRLWGSASYPQNNININYKLLFAPQEILDYVMAHELSHLKVRNHSQRFWKLVEKAVPDHKERRKWLRENGSSLTPESRNEATTLPQKSQSP